MNVRAALHSGCVALALLCLLGGCSLLDDLPDWMGGSDHKTPLPGVRIDVLSEGTHAKVDPSLKDVPVIVPTVTANATWPQEGGGPAGMTGNLAVSGFTHHDSERVGKGYGWDEPLYPSPIVANGTVYAMDAKGYISAHDAANIEKVRWTNKSLVEKHRPSLLGGGLAFDKGVIYATSGRGKVAALDAMTGKEKWKQTIGIPMRAAPKTGGGKVYVLSEDNQLFALDAASGTTLWSNRGMNENAGFLSAISPAVTDTIVFAPYSSGELHALDTNSGQDVWNDALLLPKRTTASGTFSGIGGNPVVSGENVYAVGSSGFLAAMTVLEGRHLWEVDLSSLNMPWIAGDFLYIITIDNNLACIQVSDGKIKWMQQLEQYEDAKKHKNPRVWRGPIMANGQLLVAGRHGQMLEISPTDGKVLASVEIPEDITDTPVIAGGRLYFMTEDATLHVLY
jgi:outer membrane protein assembly factor BamB